MTERIRLTIELVPKSDPIRGRAVADGDSKEFVGWLGLLSALQGAIDSAGVGDSIDEAATLEEPPGW